MGENMKQKLDFYIFYKLNLQKRHIQIEAQAFTLNGKPIMGINPDTKFQILDDSNSLTVESDENEIIFAKLIEEDIPITDNINKLDEIIKKLYEETINHLLLTYEIRGTEKLASFYPKETLITIVFLESKKSNISDGELKLMEEYVHESLEISYTKSIKKLRKRKTLPSKVIRKLQRKVLNQDDAIVKIVTNTLLNQRIIDLEDKDLLRTNKATMLLDGPTGVDKTLLVSLLAEETKLPVEIVSVTNYSGVGYVGESLESILVNLLRKTDGNLERAQRGIVCFDEIDKLATTDLDIRKGIAEELLTWLSGTKIKISYQRQPYVFDTSKLTFICLGAFTDMREANKNQIGFDKEKLEDKKYYDTEDYIKFGMPREFMGRFNSIISLNPLKLEDLENIIINSEISPLNNLITILESFGTKVTVSEDLPHTIACLAYKENIGARSLSRIVIKIRDKVLYHVMEKEISSITLTSDMLNDDYEFELEKEAIKKLQ